MFLKAIEMIGFKTFADKTRIQFDEGVTIIVGPNGSGKSNILDALRWVMGERSPKHIRADNMEDVLFNGSDVRKPGSACSVTLYLENKDNFLPSEYKEIEICRKYYRSGESEFFINKKPVLLKDIQELFMDSGFGRNSYAFIQQEQINYLLQTVDKRPIFEEAAGISRYKAKRAEAMMKLEKTRENLNRVNDILEEVEKNMTKSRLQAEIAEKASKIDAEIKELEIKLFAIEYLQTNNKKNVESQKEIKQKEKTLALETEIKSLEEKIKEASSSLDKTKDTRADFEKKIIELQGKETTLVQKKDHYNAQRYELIRQNEESQIQINSLLSKKKNLLEKLNENEEKLKNNSSELETKRISLSSAEKEYLTLSQSLDSIEEESDLLRKKIVDLTSKIEEKRNSLKDVFDEFLQKIDDSKQDLLERHNRRDSLTLKVNELLNEISSQISYAQKILNSETADIVTLRSVIEKIKESFEELRSKHSELQILDDSFQALLFDKKGLQGLRYNIEEEIRKMEAERVAAQNRISLLEDQRKNLTKSIDKYRSRISDFQNKLSRLNAEYEGLKTNIENFKLQLKEYDERINTLNKDCEERLKKVQDLDDSIKKTEEDILKTRKEIQKIQDTVTNTGSDLKEISDRIEIEQNKLEQKKRQLKELEERRRAFELEVKGLETHLADLRQLLFENYGLSIDEALEKFKPSGDVEIIKRKIQQLKENRKEFGHVNHMAVDEYKEYNERFKHLSSQKQDIEKAEKDLLEVIKRINEESEKVFMETFKKIRDNYADVIRRLFRGGRADIKLLNPDDPLNSEIEIFVQPPGKHNKMAQLSGGENTMSMIGLIFAIFLVKPAPFCVLDEIEATLDELNTSRFVNMVKEFQKKIQFVLVTHNKVTMTAANLIYGVTMDDKKDPSVSKVISLKLDEIDFEKYNIKEPKQDES